MTPRTNTWSRSHYCVQVDGSDLRSVAKQVQQRVCRTDCSEPGFCVLQFEQQVDSQAFRRLMLRLAGEIAKIQQEQTGEQLVPVKAMAFDQQLSTKPHLDGGPEESLLLLGYEPSEVASELTVYDLAKCAFERGCTPQELIESHNPMFESGLATYRHHATRIDCFDPQQFQIVCINNSSAAYEADSENWQGVLHQATIFEPDERKSRIVNSMMLTKIDLAGESVLSESELDAFVSQPFASRDRR